MPELPEVEAIRRKLNQVLPEKTVLDIERLREKSFPEYPEMLTQLRSQKILSVERRAKILQFSLTGDYDLFIHLKMTGQLIYLAADGQRLGGGHPTADWVQNLPSKHTRVIFSFSDQSKLFFNDLRVFGWVKVFAKNAKNPLYRGLGPDVISTEEIRAGQLNPQTTEDMIHYLWQQAQKRSIPIKQLIMENQVLCGVGNIYANEALFRVGISPFRPSKLLKLQEIRELSEALRAIVLEAVQLGGTTFDGMYVNVDGFAGEFQQKLLVYGQEGKACSRCGNLILRKKQAGRSSFYCPHCQI
ncbi:Formamidopyrimidine-DNA glycosylase [bioreactor metagenome]|uniref:Formamidopyrimidine-DNA glycosylase n=1 Tax=bioreactor metagenome TaxID=1076179 RepID=A0A645AVN8_9ZZZZ